MVNHKTRHAKDGMACPDMQCLLRACTSRNVAKSEPFLPLTRRTHELVSFPVKPYFSRGRRHFKSQNIMQQLLLPAADYAADMVHPGMPLVLVFHQVSWAQPCIAPGLTPSTSNVSTHHVSTLPPAPSGPTWIITWVLMMRFFLGLFMYPPAQDSHACASNVGIHDLTEAKVAVPRATPKYPTSRTERYHGPHWSHSMQASQ
mmetsp:Transcript_136078/g.236061  ORF Transcript_136078/g.236061 Transcript_136078/m.236061 type:complete len:202 (-) Transcript_136078:694-1299(-)